MDQLAPVLQWLKRNSFWLVSGVLSILSLVGWYLASNQIAEQTQGQVRKIQSSFSDMTSVRSVSAVTSEDGAEQPVVAHPNALTEEKMTQELSDTIDAITAVWKKKRDEQEALLVFPKGILGEKTFEFFNQGKTAEDFANGTVVSATEKTYLRTYREQIPRQIEKIARHVKAYWKYDSKLIEEELRAKAEMEALNAFGGGMGGGMAMGGGMGDEIIDFKRNKYAVIWNEANQNLWQRKMIEFRDWDDNSGSTQDPTILQAYILQQDVWLLEAMFNVIRQVNGEATTNDLAVIKEIDYIGFGREAREKLGQLALIDKRLGGSNPADSAGAGGLGGMDDEMSDADYYANRDTGYADSMDGMDGMGGETGIPGVFDINADPSPFHGRYVDSQQEPIAAETVRTTINGDQFPEENLELIVAKRVPFRLAVRMDERKINQFLAYCANSPFSFEVQQIRINMHDPKTILAFKGGVQQKKTGAMSGMGGGMMDGMDGMMDGMDGMMGGMMDGMSDRFGTNKLDVLKSTRVETRLNYDVRVEFHGIVRIYNPVRKDYLLRAVGLPSENPNEGEQPVADGVAVLERRP